MQLPWNICSLNSPRTVAVLTTIFIILSISVGNTSSDNGDSMPQNEVQTWAKKIGTYAFSLANLITHFDEISENYKSNGARIKKVDGLDLVKQMAEDVTNMMKHKTDAVLRVMNVAEEANLDPNVKKEEYFFSKKINRYYPEDHKRAGELMDGDKEMVLTLSDHFQAAVNLTETSIHVPTNVFENGPDVKEAIKWSEALDRIFISNYDLDPTLSWQYFGSSTGFLRQYPASKWTMDENDPDLYDSRLRTWYISAANSPKDMIILLDVSGSMTGLRREIARHVVLNILDTLNENDFVNIFTFSENTIELHPCFNETLVQANLENVGEFKLRLRNLATENIANFTLALSKAFELLQKYNRSGQGSQCNQAIMLVTDGAPYKFNQIFKKYNRPQLQVRLFTYLIGREVADVANLRWMACANKGYFVHVTTLAEVREQVLKYIPVMARPMVMYQDSHPHIWTGVYADIANPVSTIQEIELASNPEKVFGRRDSHGTETGYRLMTTVSVPVFDRRRMSARTANLLGVAGADVPIREIQKLVPPYKLGVNGYSFMVNTNGHILYHPDLRPIHEESNAEFQDILKPNYNSVDLSEVELVDNYDEPRYNHSELRRLRTDMIQHEKTEATLQVKVHLDDMKRVSVRTHNYYAYPIRDTSFSLGIALPGEYGKYRVQAEVELSLEKDPKFNASDYFNSSQWRLHPEWVYCEYKYDQDSPDTKTPESLMIHFLNRAQSRGWKWRSTRTTPPQEKSAHSCDKHLVQELLFDAKVTNIYSKIPPIEQDSKEGRHKDFGITSSFVATRSGLTRWADLTTDEKPSDEPHYFEIHNKAIDEVWYKRAVEYYEEDPNAYVYSVPFDAATRDPEEVLVTATRAIYVTRNSYEQAPAAVVGITIKLKSFQNYFKETTTKCSTYANPSICQEDRTCASPNLDCYLLDDHGFVVSSKKEEHIGKFFGVLEGTIMESLVQSEIYNQIKIFDYQAVCLESISQGSFASIMLTPIKLIQWTIQWVMGNIMWVLVKTQLYELWDPNMAWAYAHAGPQDYSLPHENPHNEYLEETPQYNDDEMNPSDPASSTPSVKKLSWNLFDYVADQKLDDSYYEAPEYQDPSNISYEDDDDYDITDEDDYVDENADSFPQLTLAWINKTTPKPCDKHVDLYKLNNSKLLDYPSKEFRPVKGKLSNCNSNGCGRPFNVQKVEKTNLVLIVVNTACPCEAKIMDIVPKEVEYNETMQCQRLLLNHFRKRPSSCFNYHPDELPVEPMEPEDPYYTNTTYENDIKLCGGGGYFTCPPLAAFLLCLVMGHAYAQLLLAS